jgi:hypothetical protein
VLSAAVENLSLMGPQEHPTYQIEDSNGAVRSCQGVVGDHVEGDADDGPPMRHTSCGNWSVELGALRCVAAITALILQRLNTVAHCLRPEVIVFTF